MESEVLRFWGLLDPANQSLLTDVGTTRDYDPGTIVCHEGDPSQHVLVVLRGLMRVTAISPGGHEKVLAIRGPGDIVGERSAVDGLPRSASVRVLGEASALVIAPARFTELCRQQPRIAWAVLTVVVSRQRDADRQRIQFTGTSTQRVAAVLLDVVLHRGVGSAGAVALSQEELASAAGTSRESLVRVLRLLREQGIVRTGRRRIDILAPDRLYDLVG
jgi:CRP-like cAMP-binding protein